MSQHFRSLIAALCGATVLVLAGCGESTGPSGATCPQGSALTYQNFGKTFMDTYCTRCHSTVLSGAARQDAPEDQNFNTPEGVRAHLKDVDAWTASGPDRTNTEMPPNGTMPTDDERKKLGEWLACGAP
ncbi:c-type cytochrome [Archangium lipolyticum]|uniref:c-type cytochrome n=1 Tax=Archangium lipolyticum TaxID=2970465 RepID=UPI002149B9A1|nr:c-type cytochrome [Archangium lipolyticum]